jgi:predicted HicB family RNase H-like nuclease
MNYKGYIGQVVYDEEAGILHGEVINTRDVITFQGACDEEVKRAFVDSVDDYLEFCASRGEQPEKPFSGKFVVRLPAELHQRAYARAKAAGISLNEFVKRAVEKQIA